jgi:PKD repeat protein
MKRRLYISTVFALVFTLTLVACKKKSTPPAAESEAPVASFTVSNDGCIGPCTVSFVNTSKNASSYSWDFGDGSASTEENPSHLYSSAGTFNVQLTATSSGVTKTTSQSVSIGVAQYYLRYKVDGTLITAVDISAIRGSTSTPRTVTLSGSAAAGANPVFTFYTEETYIGFTAGINVGCSSSTNPSDYIHYTNSNGTAYSTANDANGITLFVSSISYTNGGDVAGTFGGSIKTTGGTTAQITEGEFKLKFSN